MDQYLGEIKMFLQNNIPEGYEICDGRCVFINKYPRLYMTIGCKYGGDGKTFFMLPDLREKKTGDIVFCIAFEGRTIK